ncbi:MAG: DNA integrity scanning diadenylate cyclase DisA [Acidimicrobiales bacterium]
MVEALRVVAPGRPLREGLDRILQANKGAIIVVGDGPDVLEICSGGFLLDAEFTPQRVSELTKMDGAIFLAGDAGRIARANVHLVPSPAVPTSETGTRHRTAERVARSIDVPVIAVSEEMGVITVFRNDSRHVLDALPRLIGRANQALQTLERYRNRLDAVMSSLSAVEVEDLVTVRDVVTALQRAEMVRRIAEEVEGHIIELGTDGRLVRLQLEELMAGVDGEPQDVLRDYLPDCDGACVEAAMASLAELESKQLLDPKEVARLLGLDDSLDDAGDLDASLLPRGFRLLGKVPRLPQRVAAAVVERFGSLQKVMRAAAEDLEAVPGVGVVDARLVKEGLSRLAESSILDRFS